MNSPIQELVETIWMEVESRNDVVTGRTLTMPNIVLAQTPVDEARVSKTFPVLGHLDVALALAHRGPLASLIKAIEQNLDSFIWSQNASYTEKTCSRSFLDGYAYAGLSGPDGPLFWSAPRTGIMLMGPNVLYPAHNHEPREIYLAMTSGAQWRLDGGDWFDVQAGDLIYHDRWQMHEMRTRDIPLLAVAAWIEPGDRKAIAWDPKRQGATV